MKKSALEKTPKIGETKPVIKEAPSVTKSKGKEKIVTEDIQELEALSARVIVTRSSARKL